MGFGDVQLYTGSRGGDNYEKEASMCHLSLKLQDLSERL